MPDKKSDQSREFIKLLAGCERRLTSYVLTLVPQFSDADEILQETKLRLWEQFDDYDHEAPFGAWASTIAYYQVMTYRNRIARDRHVFSTDFLSLMANEIEVEQSFEPRVLDALSECMRQLAARSRRLLQSYYRDGESVERIGGIFGMSIPAVRKALYRSRLGLSRCIKSRLKVS